MRVVRSSSSLAALLLIVGCGADPAKTTVTGASTTAGGTAGSSTSGSMITGGTVTTGGGGGSGTGSGPTTTGPFSGAGGYDNGGLFSKDAAVAVDPGAGGSNDAGSTPEAATVSDAGNKPPGDGNVAIAHLTGSLTGTAEFTQRGVDVTVVISLTNCATGAHPIRIHGGFSCDTVATEGVVWDGRRGDGIGGPSSTINCDANKIGMMTYTRLGNDPTQNWTVADHNLSTDVTSHVVIVSDVTTPTTRIACGNFF
jgi:hypothetical protein